MIKQLEEECWALDITFAQYVLPRLLYFKNWTNLYSYPNEVEDYVEWNEILEELTWTFSYISRGYPLLAGQYIEDVNFIGSETTEIEILYTDKALYKKACNQDSINLARCNQGLKLFAKYYMSLWN